MRGTALGGEDRRPAETSHTLGSGVHAFASRIERWNGQRGAQKSIQTITATRGGVGLKSKKDTDLPRCLKKRRFLDNGEGKICVSSIRWAADGKEPAAVLDMMEARASCDKVKRLSTEYYLCESAPVPVLPNDYATVPHASRMPKDCLPLAGKNYSQDTPMLPGSDETDGLRPPQLSNTNAPVTGRDKAKLRKSNRHLQQKRQREQEEHMQWTSFTGEFCLPGSLPPVTAHKNQMCPLGLARLHPAGDLLYEWSQLGCPTMTGRPWTIDELEAAIARGPHKSAMSPNAMAHFASEVDEKVKAGQAHTVLWDDI